MVASVGAFLAIQNGVFTKNVEPVDNGLAITPPPLETSPTLSTPKESAKTTNPLACNHTDYKMAFVLIAQNQSQVTFAKVNKLTAIKDVFAKDFSTATNGLATMDTSYHVVTIEDDDGALVNYNLQYPGDKILKKFYENNPDNFDFVSLYSTFNDANNGTQFHPIVKNNVKGILYTGSGGYIRDNAAQYGSKGRLLGINLMPNIDNIPSPENGIQTSGGLLHETGHQWCCSVGDDFARGENGAKLEIIQQGIHFYRGLASPNKTGDPMGSDNWVSNGDGTYSRDNQPGIPIYHPFELYFMGLLPKSEYSKKYTIYDAGIVGKDFNDKTAKFYKEVSVEDIIKVAGERSSFNY